MKRFKIGMRLMLSFGIILILMILGAAIVLFEMNEMKAQANRVHQADTQVVALLRVYSDVLNITGAQSISHSQQEMLSQADADVRVQQAKALALMKRNQRGAFVVLSITGLLILLVASILGFMVQRSIAEPLKHLAKAAKALGQGDFQPMTVTGSDELAQLGHAFNYASSQLRELYEKLQHSEAHFRSLIEEAADLITVHAPDGTITYVSPSIERISGYRAKNMIGKNTLDLIHPDDVPRLKEMFAQAARSTESISASFRIRRKDGELRFIETVGHSIGSVGIVLNSRDITERKKVEDSLHIREELLRATFNATADGILVVDKDGSVSQTNRQFAQMWQIPDDVLSTGDDTLLIEFILDQLEDPEQFQSKVKELYQSSREYKDEISFKDGRVYDRFTCPLLKDGVEVGRVWDFRDITERKHAEESIRRLNEDLEKRVALRTGQLEFANNEMRQVLQKLEVAYNELKEAQSKMLQQEKMASIGQLAAGVAHEINNPMGFISSNLNTLDKYVNKLNDYISIQAELMQQCPEGEMLKQLDEKRKVLKIDYIQGDIRDLIKESLDGADRVKKIVQNLKSFSRVDQMEHKPADINECMESTINIVWNELKYKTTVEKEYGEIPLTKCYPQQLNQVFMNLLVNAAHAIENQGVITVKTWREDGFINVSVSDTGKGIDPEHLNRIFEPFFTTKEVGKGTGLGLSIAYDIIKKHSGEITVQSTVGKGTCFNIHIPIVEG